MLYSSIYNLHALLGRKATFTHSLTLCNVYNIGYIKYMTVGNYVLHNVFSKEPKHCYNNVFENLTVSIMA